MNARTSMHNRWIKYTALAAGWAFLGFVLSLEVYFNSRAENMRLDFVDLAIPQFGRVVMWCCLTPLILMMRSRMPLNRGNWVGGVGFHLAASLLVMGTFYFGRVVGYGIFFVGFDLFWEMLVRGFYGRNIIDVGFYWTVIGFGYSWEIYQRLKNEELKAIHLEARLVETELKALREQLHPHFLFNTMNTISVFVREGRNEEAVNLIARLCSLLRRTLDSSRTPEVTVGQEMDFLSHYIGIQMARFSDRLTVSTSIEPEAMKARIPNLLLQPLVENAIVHGIAPKAGPGRIDIRGFVQAGRLHLQVCDDGPGVDDHAKGPEGIGLSNTRERITRIYGTHAQLSLRSERGKGVTVEIILPCRT